MSIIDEILSTLPMQDMADRLGVSPDEAAQTARLALPSLLAGIEANAQDPAGKSSLLSALNDHDPALIDNGVNLDQLDLNDGEAILSHVFGPNEPQVMDTLGQVSPAAQGLSAQGLSMGSPMVRKVMMMLAPVVMSWLAKRIGGAGLGGQITEQRADQGGLGQGGGGILGDILGNVLGGNVPQGGDRGGDVLGDLLGGALGGGRQSGGPDLGDLLGGLLGAGRR